MPSVKNIPDQDAGSQWRPQSACKGKQRMNSANKPMPIALCLWRMDAHRIGPRCVHHPTNDGGCLKPHSSKCVACSCDKANPAAPIVRSLFVVGRVAAGMRRPANRARSRSGRVRRRSSSPGCAEPRCAPSQRPGNHLRLGVHRDREAIDHVHERRQGKAPSGTGSAAGRRSEVRTRSPHPARTGRPPPKPPQLGASAVGRRSRRRAKGSA